MHNRSDALPILGSRRYSTLLRASWLPPPGQATCAKRKPRLPRPPLPFRPSGAIRFALARAAGSWKFVGAGRQSHGNPLERATAAGDDMYPHLPVRRLRRPRACRCSVMRRAALRTPSEQRKGTDRARYRTPRIVGPTSDCTDVAGLACNSGSVRQAPPAPLTHNSTAMPGQLHPGASVVSRRRLPQRSLICRWALQALERLPNPCAPACASAGLSLTDHRMRFEEAFSRLLRYRKTPSLRPRERVSLCLTRKGRSHGFLPRYARRRPRLLRFDGGAPPKLHRASLGRPFPAFVRLFNKAQY